jgi:hypothetical protein
MQHRVRSKLRGLAWLFVAAMSLLGCSFDASALPTQREQPPEPVSRDDRGAAASSAGSAGSAGNDGAAGATRPPDPPMTTDAAPPPGKRDAQVVEPPPGPMLDAGTDAGVDARVEPTPDAAVPDASAPDASVSDASAPDTSVPDAALPDASVPPECDPDLPCVCPHLLEESVADGPCLCALSVCAPDDDCRLLWFQSTSYYFCDLEHTWDDANDHCESVPNLHLAAIEGAAEDEFILANVSDKTWLGGNDSEQEGRWEWPSGDRFYEEEQGALNNAYVNWHSSEPNNDGLSESAADCMLLWYENSVWADGSCGDEHGYVCELER